MPKYSYDVVEVKDSLFRGKQSGQGLKDLMNSYAQQGWRFKMMLSDDIKGRMGIGSTSGLLLVFEFEHPNT